MSRRSSSSRRRRFKRRLYNSNNNSSRPITHVAQNHSSLRNNRSKISGRTHSPLCPARRLPRVCLTRPSGVGSCSRSSPVSLPSAASCIRQSSPCSRPTSPTDARCPPSLVSRPPSTLPLASPCSRSGSVCRVLLHRNCRDRPLRLLLARRLPHRLPPLRRLHQLRRLHSSQ